MNKANRGLTRREALGLIGGSAFAQAQRRRPNIVFLLSDDQRWDTLGCMGNRIIQTPQIDILSKSGVTFENQFVTTAICVASRASIFTGQYERTHGMTEFSYQLSGAQFARTYPGILRSSGYRTGFIGKYGLDGPPLPSNQFDYWRGFAGQGRYLQAGDKGPHLTRVMGDQALEFLGTCSKNQPFFLQVSFKAPHAQDDDPRQFIYDPADVGMYRDAVIPPVKTSDPKYVAALPAEVQRSEGRRRWAVRFSTPELYQQSVKAYYRLISEVDREVGRVREQLERQGLSDNTVIIYSSDNGFYLGEHGMADKWIPHEESIRVPLVIFDPRSRPALAGARREELTLNIDIAPTILGLAGAPVPESMQGRDLGPLLAGRQVAWRQEFFYEHTFTNPGGWIPRTEGLRDQKWKYFRYLDINPLFEELYDLEKDPLETRNLAKESTYQAELIRLRGRWDAWRRHLDGYRVQNPWAEPAA
jgi:arylsulfatase A-like enzyme